MRDSISEALGLPPLENFEEFYQEQKDWYKSQKGTGTSWGSGPSHGRTKGSKNVSPYPMTKAVIDKLKKLNENAAARKIGRIWVTNGKVNKFVYPETIPDGFVKGRVMKTTTLEYKARFKDDV